MSEMTPKGRLPSEWEQQIIVDINDLSAQLESAINPLTEGNTEAFRSVTSVSGGALIASISVVQFLASKLTHPSSGWLLPLSWILFVIAIIGAAYSQGALTTLRTFRLRAFEGLNDELTRIAKGDAEFQSYEEFRARIYAHANEKIGKASKLHDAMRLLTGWCFVGGFISLVLFAIFNLPF